MKLLRAVPALLALSLLTGCDVNALLAKGGTNDNQNGHSNNNQQLNNVLSQAELKSVAAFKDGLVSAAGQGLAAAGTVNTLKSVAALRSVSAYRVSGADEGDETPWSFDWETMDWDAGDWAAFDASHDKYEELKDTFEGDMRTSNDPFGWYVKGDFTLPEGLTATGKAGLVSSSDKITMNALKDFKASALIDVTLTSVPESDDETVASLEGSRIRVTLQIPEPNASYLKGAFTLNDDTEPTGTLIVDLLDNSWTVEIPTQEDGQDRVISLTKGTDGGWTGRVYGVKEDKADYADKRAEFSWGSDGKLRINGKETTEQMPL